MKNALLLALVMQSRNPQVIYQGKVYQLTNEGKKIKRPMSLIKIVLLVGFILFYSFIGQFYVQQIFGESIFATIILVLIAYILILGLTFLIGHLLLWKKDDMSIYVNINQ